MILNKYVAMAVLLVTICSAHATIIQMEEFYNSDLNQTLILMHDFHSVLPVVDGQQVDDVMQVMSAIQAPLITEAPLPIPPNDDLIMAMYMLVDACQKKR